MNKLKLISDCKYELMAIFGGVGAICADHKLLFIIHFLILIIGLVGITAQVIAIIVFKKLVLYFEKLVEKKYSNEK
jgi:hypothetical protein